MKGKINTIIISQNFPPIEGGIQTYMYELAKNWKLGDVKVLCELVKDEPTTQITPYVISRVNNQKVSFLKSITTIASILFFKKKITYLKIILFFLLCLNRNILTKIVQLTNKLSELIDDNCQYVVQCSKPLHIGVVGLVAKAVYGFPLITYIHGTELNTYKKKYMINLLYKFVMKNSNFVFSNSNYTKDLAVKMGAQDKNIIVQNLGANINNFFPKDTKEKICDKYKINKKCNILLTVSHLIERKGHIIVIQALKILLSKGYDIHYLIIGQGDYKFRIQEEINNLSLQNHVTLAGFVESNQMIDYMNSCDIFVMPNKQVGPDFEGFGIVFLEANACKKPVIGGKSGGVPDAVLDGITGLLVNPHNVDEIANKIELLISDTEFAQKLAENGYRRVIETNNWKSVCDNINSTIKKII